MAYFCDMRQLFIGISGLLIFLATFTDSIGQQSFSNISNRVDLERQLNLLINDLNLTWDQKLSLGIITLNHSSQFDFTRFQNAGKMKQYCMFNVAIRKLEKDIKPILSKEQFKIYKKHKKKLRKSLVKSGK